MIKYKPVMFSYLVFIEEAEAHTFGELWPLIAARLNEMNAWDFRAMYSSESPSIYYNVTDPFYADEGHTVKLKPDSVTKILKKEREMLHNIKTPAKKWQRNDDFMIVDFINRRTLVIDKDYELTEAAQMLYEQIITSPSAFFSSDLALSAAEWLLLNNAIDGYEFFKQIATEYNDFSLAMLLSYYTFHRPDLIEPAIDIFNDSARKYTRLIGNARDFAIPGWIMSNMIVNPALGEHIIAMLSRLYMPHMNKVDLQDDLYYANESNLMLFDVVLAYLHWKWTGDAQWINKFDDEEIQWGESSYNIESILFWGDITDVDYVDVYLGRREIYNESIKDALSELWTPENNAKLSL